MHVKEHAFSLSRPIGSIPLKIVKFLSKVKFNIEGELFEIEHIHQFFSKCISCGICFDNEIRNLFTLTFEGRIIGSCKAFPTKSIHNWDQFMDMLLAKHQDYDYEELWNELTSVQKEEDEFLE